MASKSISKALLTNVLSVYFVLTALVTAVQIIGEYFDSKSVLLQELKNQQSTFRSSMSRSLWEYRYDQVDEFARSLINIPAIAGIRIRDDKGEILVNLGAVSDLEQLSKLTSEADFIPEQDGIFGYHSALVFEFSGDSTQVGDVSLFSTRAQIFERLRVSLYFILINALVKSAFLLLLFSLAFQRMLKQPMRELTEQIHNFRLDDLAHSRIKISKQRNTEFTMVEQAYNQLLETLADYQADLKLTAAKYSRANQQLDTQNATLEQEVARKTASLSRVLVDLERRKNELEARQAKLEREIKQRQVIEEDLRDANTRLQNSVRALERAQTQLIESEKMASLGGLVAGITHDVTTPIGTSITSASFIQERMRALQQALDDKNLTEAQLIKYLADGQEASQLLESSLNRASELIGSFKQVAVDQTSDAVRDIHLKKYLQDVIQALYPQFKNTQHQVTLNCADDLYLHCPAGAYAQIFTNLIQNSLLHGFDNISDGQIDIDIQRDEDHLVIRYADNGRGVPADQMEQLFDLFFTTKRQQGGSGLGTHIVFNLVTQTLHGTITASSEPGQGLTYRIIIPAQFIHGL